MTRTLIFIMLFSCIMLPVSAQDDNEALIERLDEARDLYNKAIEEYNSENMKNAVKLYKKAMSRFSSIELSPDMNYVLKDDFLKMFDRMHELLRSTQPAADICLPLSGADIPSSYVIPMDCESNLVQKYIKRYTEGKEKKRILQALERSGRYRAMILKVLDEYGLPRELVYLPVVESLYKINAYSSAKAVGLWQLMSFTGRNLGLKINYWIDERRDPEKSTIAAAKFLSDLYLLFNDWHIALAAYNRGQNGISRDLKFSKSTSYDELGFRKAIPSETEHFVPKFIASTIIGDNYREYGYDLVFEEPMIYDEVVINNVIDLEIAAKCAGTTVKTLRNLNPAINAWCTPINYPDFILRIPRGTRETFLENIAKVKDLNPSRGFVKYKVRRGEVLGKIASKFHTTVKDIKQDNKLSNANIIRIGQVLTIRPGRKYYKR